MILHRYGLVTTRARNKPAIHIPGRYFSKSHVYDSSPILKQRFVPTSGTYPKGFIIGSSYIGMKPASMSQPDLVLIASEKPSCGAAVFTKNEFPAPSIIVTRELLLKTKGYGLNGVIANSWCSNTITGKAGLGDAVAMSKEADRFVSCETGAERESSVMVMHTGISGQR
jgi:glutamate N-acetyltransferase/amino-acid N-acetyltransferase